MLDFTKNEEERQARVSEAARYFDLLFGAVREKKYSYLWSKRGEEKVTSPFDVSTPDNRRAMAQKAIELNDAGFDVYVGVNLTDVPCNENSRAKTEDISTVVATITDIDTEGGTHISNDKKKYPPTFDVAKSFLPFPLSSIVDSGYGLHGAAIFNTPLAIDDSNRKEAIARNKKFLEVIRSKAGNFAGAVDSIGDLPRVLRVPGTRNYKLGISADAPLCHIVDVADVRFDPADLDQTLNSLLPAATQKTSQPARASSYIYHADDNPDLKEFRIRRMLDFISPSSLTYDEWLAVGIALFNEGFDCGVWEQWSRADNRFKDGECEAKWKTFHYDATGNKIGTLYQYAIESGYDEKETQRDFHQSHPESSKKTRADDNLKLVSRHMELLAKLEELKKLPMSEDKISKIRRILHKLCHWSYDKNGNPTKIKPDVYNYKLIFGNDPNLTKLFGRDDFRQETIFLRRAAWHNKDAPLKDSWDDADDAELRLYLAENYAEMSNPQRTFDFIIRVARENSFHSIKKFFDGLPKWDGVPRMKKLFVKFLGADDTEYTHEVTRHALLGAIARAFYPGCDFQSVVVLQGPQGIGKSRVIRMLGGKHGVNKGENWHVALRDQLDDSHAVDAMRKGWIVEIEEFAAGSRADVNAMKGVLSADDVTRRFAYDRRAKTIKAHWTFFATCNDDAPLRDQTGNRRFLPIKCKNKQSQTIPGMTADYIQQVWAEALVEFKELFPTVDDFDDDKLRLSPEIQAQAAAQAENITQDDGLTTEIKGYLDKKILPPVIWYLLSREERHKFFVEGGKFQIEKDDLQARFKNRVGKKYEELLPEFEKACTVREGFLRHFTDKDNRWQLIFYGSELRQHICAAEIFNECFGSDNRKRINRINEILSMLDGWHLGERLQKADPTYKDQKKVYYRDKDNCPGGKEQDRTRAEHPAAF